MSLSQTLQALSEPNRRKIIDLLKKREMSVGEMLKHLSVTMPTLSHHLDVLKRADLISSRREGQQIIYSLNLSVVEEITEQIIKFLKI
ncbi:MAG: winged helix-turn-helix transcriptional regulator [Patescibacteria group bacterium]|nr:winged helix-turn-helix transcriptional regulator [Patescibacteria group bacterium]